MEKNSRQPFSRSDHLGNYFPALYGFPSKFTVLKQSVPFAFTCNRKEMAEKEEEEDQFESWEDDNDDDEDLSVKSLFCDLVFPSVGALITSDKESFGFDLREAAGSVQYDDIALIMLVNFIRRRVHGLSSSAVVDRSFVVALQSELAAKTFLQDDANMRPVLNDDPLLFLLRDALIASGTIVDDDDEEIEAKETQAAVASAQQQLQLAGGSSSSSNTNGEELLKKYQSIVASLTAEPDATKVLICSS